MLELLDQFPLPEVAVEALTKQARTTESLGDGVALLSGHDKGVAYKFDIVAIYNQKKSQELGYEYHDEREMIQWFRDRRSKPTEQVRFLPPALLDFNKDGECIGGRYADAYNRWKAGLQAPGMPLNKWDVLSAGECATLAANGIFTVEQFADFPADKLNGVYPIEYMHAHERARMWVNGKVAREDAVQNQETMAELMAQNVELLATVADMQKALAKQSKPKAKAKRKTRAKTKRKTTQKKAA